MPRRGWRVFGCLIRCWPAVSGKGVHDGPPPDCAGRSCWQPGMSRRTFSGEKGAGRLEHFRYRWNQRQSCACSSGIPEVRWWRGVPREASRTPPNAIGSFRLRCGRCRALTCPDRRGVGCGRRCNCTGTAFECQRGLLRFVVVETAASTSCTMIWLSHMYATAGW